MTYKVGTLCVISNSPYWPQNNGRECEIISEAYVVGRHGICYDIKFKNGERNYAMHTSLKPIEPPKSDEQEKFQAFLDKILEKTDEMILEEI